MLGLSAQSLHILTHFQQSEARCYFVWLWHEKASQNYGQNNNYLFFKGLGIAGGWGKLGD